MVKSTYPTSLPTGFEEPLLDVLELMYEMFQFDLWMVTKVEGNDWIVLAAMEKGIEIENGTVFNWEDSYCCKMVEGKGPNMAPNSNLIPCYKEAKINDKLVISAYIGAPIYLDNGEFYGTLCGVHPESVSTEIVNELPLVKSYAKILGRYITKMLVTQSVEPSAKCA